MPKKVKKVWNIVSNILVALVVIIALLLVGARLIGLQVFNVVSGSMKPTYNVGDLIYVKSVEGEDLKPDMPVTFVMNEDLVVATHRVVSIDMENQHIYTKGDANDMPDATPVHFNNVIGTPVFKIPYLGYVSDFVKSPPGSYITIAVVVVLLILVFLPDLIGKKKQPNSEEAKGIEPTEKAEETSLT